MYKCVALAQILGTEMQPCTWTFPYEVETGCKTKPVRHMKFWLQQDDRFMKLSTPAHTTITRYSP